MPSEHGYATLTGTARPPLAGAQSLGPLEGDEPVGVTIVVRPRPDAPALPTLEDWQATPPGSRVFLSPEEFAQEYGSSEEDIDTVSAFAREHGLTVVEQNAGRSAVVVTGTAAQMQAAFGVQLEQFRIELPVMRLRGRLTDPGQTDEQASPARRRSRTHTHRGFTGEVRVRSDMGDVIQDVVGLDNRQLGDIAGSGDPPSVAVPSVPTVAGLYNFPNTGASGQTIGIFNGGGNYKPSDITSYFAGLPSGYTTAPTVTDVNLTVEGTTFSNNPSAVSSSSNTDLEITQDIMTSSTVAQGVTVAVYFSKDDEQGWLTFLNRATVPGASDPQPSVLTSSWFLNNRDDKDSAGQSLMDTLSTAFAKAAARGITVFIAQGDSGAGDGVNDGKVHVQYPGSDPWVTSCGGTRIGSITAGPPATFTEWVWSDGASGSTGGGVSDYFDRPPYQSAAGVSPTSLSDNKVRRGIPDVAGNIAFSGFKIAGSGFSFFGTSCVAPLFAGLCAVLNQSLGEPIGFLNATLYAFGSTVCRDITFGNNDSADSSGSPSYSAGSGWDACTGWGVVDGAKLLAEMRVLYQKTCSLIVDKSSYGLDEVDADPTHQPSFTEAFWVVISGFRPTELGLNSSSDLNAPPSKPTITLTPDPSLPAGTRTAIQNQMHVPPTDYGAFPVLPSDPSLPNVPISFQFPCTVSFSGDGLFIDAVENVLVTATMTIGGTTVTGKAVMQLFRSANPYVVNVVHQPSGDLNPAWLSADLRLFTVRAGEDRFGATMSANPDDAPGFITAALNNLNLGSTGGDSFDSLVQDEEKSALEFQSRDGQGHPTFNFAVARVRMRGVSIVAKSVRVFFRAFQAQSASTTFDPAHTYRTASDGATYGHKIALLGVQNDGSGNPEYVTIPFFANARVNRFAPTDMSTQQDPANVRSIVPISGQEVDAYFGCWLDVNQPDQLLFPSAPPTQRDGPFSGTLQSIQQAVSLSPHQCIVAEIAFDDDPVPTTPVAATPYTSDKLAQRNVAWIDGPNPGSVESRRMSHPVEIRASAPLASRPDELLITWDGIPSGSRAELFLPAVDARSVVAAADSLYPHHLLGVVDQYTVGCPTGGVTYIPVPAGTGAHAGLLTVELPPGVRKGDVYTAAVRQVAPARFEKPPEPPPPHIGGQPEVDGGATVAASVFHAAAIITAPLAWRQTKGAFQLTITISTKERILADEERLLAVLRWIAAGMPKTKRWYPVFIRYLTIVEGRVRGFGGDPDSIPASPTWHPRPGRRHGEHGEHGHGRRHPDTGRTGKICGISYDHFGDFDGFVLELRDGTRVRYRSRERRLRELAIRAMRRRTVVTVHPEHGLQVHSIVTWAEPE